MGMHLGKYYIAYRTISPYKIPHKEGNTFFETVHFSRKPLPVSPAIVDMDRSVIFEICVVFGNMCYHKVCFLKRITSISRVF